MDGSEASALRARALLRLGEPKRAVDELRSPGDENWFDQGERSLLRAVALARIGDESAPRELEAARVYGIASGDATLEAEVEYHAGLVAFGDGSLEQARRACDRGMEAAASLCASPITRTVPFAHVASHLQQLHAVLKGAEGQYRASLAYVRSALEILDGCPIKDRWQEGFAIANFGVYVREHDLADDARDFHARVTDFPWTAELAPRRFSSAQSLVWCAMLRGEHLDALRHLRTMSSTATSVPEQIQICVDRAIHARGLGHVPMAAEEVEHGLELAGRVEWDASRGDARLVLLELAQVAAGAHPDAARTMLDRYTAIRAAMPVVYASRLEPRVRAEESFTHGLVLRAEGQRHSSTDRLATAFETWNRIGYEWRAARAAVELAELDAGEMFRVAVRRELRVRPDSIFADRARLVA